MFLSLLLLQVITAGCPLDGSLTGIVFTYGDSKTRLVAGLNNNQALWQVDLALHLGCYYVPLPGATESNNYAGSGWLGVNGTTVALRKAAIDTDLSTITIAPTIIFFNLGSNDAFVGAANPANETTWKTNLAYIWDAMHTKWPNAQIYYSETWRQGYDTESDTLAGWYSAVAANRTYIHLCDNERSWVKGSDDGATNFWDGVHFSVAGVREKARLAAACLGF